MWGRPEQAVTFVENHDVVRDTPIINDKLLAYAFILTHEGYPCVFWQDYFNWELAQPDNQSGIDALIKVHEQSAAGPTELLYVDDDLYVMQRSGAADQSGLVLVLNNRGTWNGMWVQTRWNNTRLIPAAWRGRDDVSIPEEKWTNESLIFKKKKKKISIRRVACRHLYSPKRNANHGCHFARVLLGLSPNGKSRTPMVGLY